MHVVLYYKEHTQKAQKGMTLFNDDILTALRNWKLECEREGDNNKVGTEENTRFC
jgi:hypothetical protein